MTAQKSAIVTGSNRGIGRAIALQLAREGTQVVLCARDREKLDQVVREIHAAGGSAIAVPLDLRLPESAPQLVAAAIAAFGAIDILVNNAGATKRGEFHDLSDEDWTDGFALKFFGAVRLTRAAWPHLKERSGTVINISGIGGRTPGPLFTIGGSVNAALLSFTKAMADVGVRDGVRVNAVSPGSVRTDRLARRLAAEAAHKGVDLATAERELVRDAGVLRVGEPEDIAYLVAFLAGPHAGFLQGSLIDIDGGQTKTI